MNLVFIRDVFLNLFFSVRKLYFAIILIMVNLPMSAIGANLVIEYQGVCTTDCSEIGLNAGDLVNGTIEILEEAATPGNVLENSDFQSFHFEFGNQVFQSPENTVTLNAAGASINAAGNGLTGSGLLQFRVNGSYVAHVSADGLSWLAANPVWDYATGTGSFVAPPTPVVTFEYHGICNSNCAEVGLNTNDPVNGTIEIREEEATPGNVLENSDIQAMYFQFGERIFQSPQDAILLNNNNGDVKINATGNGIVGAGKLELREGHQFFYGDISANSSEWRAALPTSNTFASGPGSFVPPDVGSTPTGSNVVVTPVITNDVADSSQTSIIIEYDNISVDGETTVDVIMPTGSEPELPSGYTIGSSNVFYDFNTTATFDGLISVCLGYDPQDFADESLIRLFHYHGGIWTDITDDGYPLAVPQLICGTTDSFSIIVPVEQEPAMALTCNGFDAPMDKGHVTVKKNRALPFKAQLLDADGISLGSDQLAAPVIQVYYDDTYLDSVVDVSGLALNAGAGTEGNQFEFIDGYWQYNLKIKNYSAAGTYLVELVSGDDAQYQFQSVCDGAFVVK